MADTSVRYSAVKKLVALLRDHDGARGVVIEPGYPGEADLRAEALWVGDITSTQEIPVMTGARMHRDDLFTASFLARVTGKRTLDETMARIEALGALIEDVLADEVTLEDLDGIVSVEVLTTDMTSGRTPDGHLGFGRFEVRFHARLT